MRWQDRRTRRNIEDRRRAAPGRTAAVGSVGALVIVLLGAFLGVDLTPLLQGGPVATEAPAPPGPNVIDDETARFVAVVLAETEAIRGEAFRAAGRDHAPPTPVLFAEATPSACGMARAAMGPFYCPGDRRVYLDTDFFRVMDQQLGAKGDFARAYVIAHEVGHHIQNLPGTLDEANALRARVSEAEANAISVRIELQADCFSGLWARAARQRLSLDRSDIAEALETAARIGDDALQRAAGRQVVPDSLTHGTSAQRQRWFHAGFEEGSLRACDTFGADRL